MCAYVRNLKLLRDYLAMIFANKVNTAMIKLNKKRRTTKSCSEQIYLLKI